MTIHKFTKSDFECWRNTFRYDSGKLYYRVQTGSRNWVGKLAGRQVGPYWSIAYKGREVGAHRVIFAMFNDTLPDLIDHIDRDKLNNDISNLRGSDKSKNALNVAPKKRGVSWCKRACKWRSSIQIKGKYKSLGYFDNKEDAYAAYDKAVLLFVDSTVLLNSEIH